MGSLTRITISSCFLFCLCTLAHVHIILYVSTVANTIVSSNLTEIATKGRFNNLTQNIITIFRNWNNYKTSVLHSHLGRLSKVMFSAWTRRRRRGCRPWSHCSKWPPQGRWCTWKCRRPWQQGSVPISWWAPSWSTAPWPVPLGTAVCRPAAEGSGRRWGRRLKRQTVWLGWNEKNIKSDTEMTASVLKKDPKHTRD